MKKLGLMVDERLSHDRKKVFTRNMSVLKMKYSIEILPSGMTEDSFINFLEKGGCDVVMIPWHLYFSWKKAANINVSNVAGYFADPLLHFEFQAIPNYQNFILLDFYRFSMDEIEILLKLLTAKSEETELLETFGKTAHYFTNEWYQADQDSSQCIDLIFENPILNSSTFHDRLPSLRLYVTTLWLACFREKMIQAPEEAVAKFILAEFNKRLMIQLTYNSPSLTSKESIKELWPTAEHNNVLFRELALHSDFLKIYHFPKTRGVSITGLFLPNQLTTTHSGEVRGFWIENRL